MRLRIVSDGTRQGTKVVNAETGEPIQNVTAVSLTIHPKIGTVLRVEVLGVEVEVEADGQIQNNS